MRIVASLLQLYILALFAYAILSWFRFSYDSPGARVQHALGQIIEPVLRPIRKVIPPIGGIDLSILILVLVLEIVVIPLFAA